MGGRRGRLRGYLVVFGGFLVYLTLGSMYSFGNLTTYLTSYIRARSHPEDLSYGQSAWILALTFASQGGLMTVGGFISLRIGPRWTTLLGCGIVSLGILLTYFTIQWNFYACIFTYSIMFGLGVGIAYSSPVSCAMKWHPQHKGLVNGIVLAGFGGGAFVFNQVQTAFINPDNKAPDLPASPGSTDRYFSEAEAADVLDRVPQCFLLLAGIYIIMQLVGGLLLADPPKDLEEYTALLAAQQNDDDKRFSAVTKGVLEVDDFPDKQIQKDVQRNIHPRDVIKSRSFYLIWFMFLFSAQSVIIISSLYKAFGQTFIYDDLLLTTVGSIASLCNAGGRAVWGQLVDKTSFRTCMALLSTIMCVMMLTFYLSYVAMSPIMYALWVCALHLIFSGNFVLFPTAMSKAYGPKYLTVNLGLVFSSQIVTGIIGAILSSTIVASLGWFGMFGMIAGFSFITVILVLVFNRRAEDGSYI